MTPLLALLPLMLASAPPGAPSRFDPDRTPPEMRAAVQRADAAAQALQRKLSGRLMQAMKEGGAAAAVSVCRDEAVKLTSDAGRDSGAVVGRTSDRLRNPGNLAPPWAEAYVASAAGKRSSEVRPAAFDLGDKLGLLRPIAIGQACTKCHGTADSVPPDVAKVLREAYPDDRASGYAEGDHRGFVWVVVPR